MHIRQDCAGFDRDAGQLTVLVSRENRPVQQLHPPIGRHQIAPVQVNFADQPGQPVQEERL